MDCKELFLNDIVDIKVYLASDVSIPIPFNVPNITELTLSLPDVPVLHIATNSMEISNDAPATLTITRERVASGFIFNHELNVSVNEGIDTAAKAIDAIGASNIILVTTDASGDTCLHYPCPSSALIDWSVSNSDGAVVGAMKITLKSMSGKIML